MKHTPGPSVWPAGRDGAVYVECECGQPALADIPYFLLLCEVNRRAKESLELLKATTADALEYADEIEIEAGHGAEDATHKRRLLRKAEAIRARARAALRKAGVE